MYSRWADYYFKSLKQYIWYQIKSLRIMVLAETLSWFAFYKEKNAVFLLKHPPTLC